MTTMVSRPQWIECALWGALGFGLTLGTVSALVGGIDAAFHIPDFDSGLKIGTLAYAIAGGFGGAAIAFSLRQNRVAVLVLAGGLGLGLGFWLTAIPYSVYVEPRITGEAAFAAAAALRFALIGAWTGFLLGATQGKWKSIWVIILAGAIGFALASVAQRAAGIYLTRISETPNPLANAIVFGAQGALGGFIGGACLGAAVWRRDQSNGPG